MAALCNFNGLAPWRNADNSLHSVNLTMPPSPLYRLNVLIFISESASKVCEIVIYLLVWTASDGIKRARMRSL